MPNAEAARVDFEKLTDYLLSETHPVGKTKAEFFKTLGFSSERPQELLAALLKIPRTHDVMDQTLTPFGTKYVVDGVLSGPAGSAHVRTIWFVDRGTAAPHLVTAYRAPKEEAR